jgi:hypothetical protein
VTQAGGAHPEGSQRVKVGVLLARQPNDLGEWLADGAAFEAAGADALWVDLAPEPELDPLALTAALAAVTYRSLLVTSLPEPDGASGALARMLATIRRLSRGRLRILADAIPSGELPEIGVGIFRRIPGEPGTFEHTREPDETERWVTTASPDSRAAWRAALLDAAEHGSRGLLVPANPRLLDLLRNPDDHDDRRDLQLAQG